MRRLRDVQECQHAGYHSGQGRYCPDTQQLRYVIVCDDCQAELSEIGHEPYRPNPDVPGNSSRAAA